MVKNKYLIITALIAALAAGIIFFVHDTQEEKVKKVFGLISDSVEKTGQENPIISAGKVKQIKDILLDSCKVEIPSRGVSRTISSQEISSYAYARRTLFKSLSLKFYDITVDFPDNTTDKTIANVGLTAVLKGTLSAGEQVEDVHELSVALKKTDEQWRIAGIEIVEILEE